MTKFYDWIDWVLVRPIRNFVGPHTWYWFWVKEALHALGGGLIGVVTLWSGYVVLGLVAAAMLAVLISKEIKEDKETQTRKKTVLDLIAWVVGFALVASLRWVI